MPLKTDPLEEPSLNLASMLDIVLLLLMFFMVGTQFKEEELQYDIKLPTAADATALSGQPDEIVVNVNAAGQLFVNQKPYSTAELESYLQSARTNFPGQACVIRGDATGPYQHVMDALSTCKRAGIRNISLAHRPAGNGPEGQE